MLTIGIVEDDIDALINVIRNLMVLDRSRYEFNLLPLLLSDPGIDTPEAIQARVLEYGVSRLREAGIETGDWPAIIQKGMLCPVDQQQRTEILQYLAARNVDAIICDSWLGKGTALESRFGEKALRLAGLMLLDDAEKEERWRGKCWIMTMYQGDVFEQLRELLEGDGWLPQRFNLFARFLKKDLINATNPSTCSLQLERVVDECLARVTLSKPSQLPAEVSNTGRFGSLIGRSQPMLAVYEKIQKVAKRNVPVVIQGESGVGKELIAREIHGNSLRAGGPFIPVDCGAIPSELMESELFGHAKGGFTGAVSDKAGLFEDANNGTLFLDEIGNLPLLMQAKLLRVLQEGQLRRVGSNKLVPFDARVLAASNKDLEREVREERFRGDLLLRLSVIDIKIPPLKERSGDVALLCDYFIAKHGQSMASKVTSISADALEVLNAFSWPWNVRQLENLIKRTIVEAGNDEIIDRNNEAIKEIAELARQGRPSLEKTPDEQGAAALSSGPLYRDMSASQIWELIKDGKVTKSLPQWAKAIGIPKTLEVIDEVIHYCHGHLPNDGETQKYFGQKYRAWNGCRLRYQKGEAE